MNVSTQFVPFHQSLFKPVLYAGMERELSILFGFSSVIIWVIGKDLMSLVSAIGIWIIGLFVGRLSACVDTKLSRVFIRHMRYQHFYPATECLDAKARLK